MVTARIKCSNIRDFETLHDEFSRVFGFPDFYGRNLDALIDCLTDLDEPDSGMTAIYISSGTSLALVLDGYHEFKREHPELLEAIIESISFVNWRRIDIGQAPVIALCISTAAA